MNENIEIYKQLAATCKARSQTYQFLARLFAKEVDEKLLEELAAKKYPYNTGNAEVDKAYLKIATFMSNTWPNTITDLAVDYVRTFIGHGNDSYACAYPFESVYTSRERLLMMGARDEVLAIYRSQGLDKALNWKEAEDHISLELEFMATMAQRSAAALENATQAPTNEGQDTKGVEQSAAKGAAQTFETDFLKEADGLLLVQKNFITQHLCAWVPMMTADMKRFAKTDLYLGLAQLTQSYLKVDKEFLDEITSDDGDEAAKQTSFGNSDSRSDGAKKASSGNSGDPDKASDKKEAPDSNKAPDKKEE